MTEPNFMQLFKFTPDDLQANRRGQLSPVQQARWAEAGQWAGSVMQTAVPLITAALIALIGITISLFLEQSTIGIMISLVIAGLVGVGLRLRARRNGRQETLVPITAVHRAEGIAHLQEIVDRSEHNTSRRYQLEIDPHIFPLFRQEQFEALENGARYAVYYLEDDNKYIVSLEKM
ncbi:MAG: hypothetical protein H6658_05525 [Ardenticatenaceae bacterium]|nr:hypothetical protein [Ardenticatenaceae bacterium]